MACSMPAAARVVVAALEVSMLLRFLSRAFYGSAFVAYFMHEVVKANLRVASEVLRPKQTVRPAILAVPLEAQTDLEILLLMNVISLTPGTISLDLSADHMTLFVHVMHMSDIAEFKKIERRLLRALR